MSTQVPAESNCHNHIYSNCDGIPKDEEPLPDCSKQKRSVEANLKGKVYQIMFEVQISFLKGYPGLIERSCQDVNVINQGDNIHSLRFTLQFEELGNIKSVM